MNTDNHSEALISFIDKIKHHAHVTAKDRVSEIDSEFLRGFEFVAQYPKAVTIYGGTKIQEGTVFYEKARALGRKIVEQTQCAVITGGGPGIMEAANRGAKEANGNSIGITIKLPHEQVTNQYVTDSVDFYYFFIRRFILAFTAKCCVFFPGGFGTLDEFFEILTLRQTHKISPVPIVLFGAEYWQPMEKLFRATLLDKYGTIRPEDLLIYSITDNEDEIIEIIKKAHLRGQ
ncbi:MAG: TIGR00730 family Rossman fold protein [Candidatus Pacebacteria bacterium]|nr:TIGR00730 family Rossman fold protein [Candidatus Paceibacterota bacterium]